MNDEKQPYVDVVVRVYVEPNSTEDDAKGDVENLIECYLEQADLDDFDHLSDYMYPRSVSLTYHKGDKE